MADEIDLQITAQGRLSAGPGLQRRLAGRTGAWRLMPSPPDLLVFQADRSRDGDAPDGGTRAGLALSGAIDRTGGLFDIVHFLHSNTWSGSLTVLAGPARKTLWFKRGDITTAASNVPEDRLGAILYRFGRVTPEDLNEALARVTQEQRVGQILVERGKLTVHDLYQYVRKQIEEIFYSVLVFRAGEFYFHRTGDDEGPPSQLLLPAKGLLFEGVRRIDEMTYFQEKIPSPESVPLPRAAAPKTPLPERETALLALCDGKRDVKAIARESRLGEFEATKILFALVQEGRVEMGPPISPPAAPAAVPARPTGHDEIVETYNRIYARVREVVARHGRDAAIRRGLESFFQAASEFAPLFAGVKLGSDGRLPRDTLLANLEIAPAANKAEYLHRGLNELLFFVLFTAGEIAHTVAAPADAVSPSEKPELELQRQLSEILREVIAHGAG